MKRTRIDVNFRCRCSPFLRGSLQQEVFNKKNVAAIDDFFAPMASIALCLPACQAVSKVPNNSSDVPDGFP
jgi:hypothetical protein